MERIAVTGATGFVGRHVVARAAAAGHAVMGLVRTEAAARVVRDAGGRAVELLGRDPEALVRALDGCGAVVHLAQIGAERGGQTYEAIPEDLIVKAAIIAASRLIGPEAAASASASSCCSTGCGCN